MRLAALATNGRYLFLTKHSGIGSGHHEPHIPCYHVVTLVNALARVGRMELRGEYVDVDPAEVIKSEGDPQDRRCILRSGTVAILA